MNVKINYHIFGLEITMRNSLSTRELNSFKKLSAEIGNHGHGECTALVEGCSIWHGNNVVGLSGENDSELGRENKYYRTPVFVSL